MRVLNQRGHQKKKKNSEREFLAFLGSGFSLASSYFYSNSKPHYDQCGTGRWALHPCVVYIKCCWWSLEKWTLHCVKGALLTTNDYKSTDARVQM